MPNLSELPAKVDCCGEMRSRPILISFEIGGNDVRAESRSINE